MPASPEPASVASPVASPAVPTPFCDLQVPEYRALAAQQCHDWLYHTPSPLIPSPASLADTNGNAGSRSKQSRLARWGQLSKQRVANLMQLKDVLMGDITQGRQGIQETPGAEIAEGVDHTVQQASDTLQRHASRAQQYVREEVTNGVQPLLDRESKDLDVLRTKALEYGLDVGSVSAAGVRLWSFIEPGASLTLSLISRWSFAFHMVAWTVMSLVLFLPYLVLGLSGASYEQTQSMLLVPTGGIIVVLVLGMTYFIAVVRPQLRAEQKHAQHERMMALAPIEWTSALMPPKGKPPKPLSDDALLTSPSLHRLVMMHSHDHHELETDVPCHSCEGCCCCHACIRVARVSPLRGGLSWLMGTAADAHGDRLPAWASLFMLAAYIYMVALTYAVCWLTSHITCYGPTTSAPWFGPHNMALSITIDGNQQPDLSATTCNGLQFNDSFVALSSVRVWVHPLRDSSALSFVAAYEPLLSTFVLQFSLYFVGLMVVALVLAWSTSGSAKQLICDQLKTHIKDVQKAEAAELMQKQIQWKEDKGEQHTRTHTTRTETSRGAIDACVFGACVFFFVVPCCQRARRIPVAPI